MNIVDFNPDRHYAAMCDFWQAYGWLTCPLDALPRAGRVAENDQGELIAYLGMYIDEGRIAVVDWALANRAVPEPERHAALRMLFDELVCQAKAQDCHYIYSFTANKKWGYRLESYGMAAAERNATSYIMPIGENKDVAFISD